MAVDANEWKRGDTLPAGIRQHLINRMRDRAIRIFDLNQLRLRVESNPEVPEDDWYKGFGSFKLRCRKPQSAFAVDR